MCTGNVFLTKIPSYTGSAQDEIILVLCIDCGSSDPIHCADRPAQEIQPRQFESWLGESKRRCTIAPVSPSTTLGGKEVFF